MAALLVRQATEAMVTSIVLNDDLVPRMSAQSIEMLADQASAAAVAQLLANTDVFRGLAIGSTTVPRL